MTALFGTVRALAIATTLGIAAPALAADYVIDTTHASIEFETGHLGFSLLTGRFDTFSGSFTFDPENPAAGQVSVDIDPASINSNHDKRDEHLRSADFLDVDAYPQARFVSTGIEVTGDDTAVITGELTLRGVTREIAIDARLIGAGTDPWGGYRAGFSGTTRITMADFGMTYNLGPSAEEVQLTLNVEGIRQ